MAIFHGNAIPSAAADYDIDYSCRVETGNVVDEGMYYTPTEDGSGAGKKFTFSCWIKRAVLGTTSVMLGAGTDAADTNDTCFRFSGDALQLNNFAGSSGTSYIVTTTAKFRDPSAWYHCVASVDTTDNTAANRVKLYVNGEYQSSLSATGYPAQHFAYKYCMQHMQAIGGRPSTAGNDLIQCTGGYLAEVIMVDNQQLTADSFGKRGDYGEWKPIRYSGSHGTNGFYLPFSDAGQRQIPQGDGTEIGDMTSGGNLTAAFDGTISASGAGAATLSGAGSHYVGKDWGSGVTKTLTGVKTWGVNDSGYESEGGHTFSLHVYGSNSSPSNATDGTKIAEIVNDLSFATDDQDQTMLSGFTSLTAYRYHWVAVTDRTSSGAAFMVEIEFYEGTPSGLGVDAAGSNDFTVSGITASDQTTDSPTNNFATMNFLDNYYAGATYSEGNLKIVTGSNGSSPASNFGMSSGKWYCEAYCVSDAGDGDGTICGITGTLQQATSHEIGHYADGYAMGDAPAGGTVVRNNNSNTSYGSGFGLDPGETIGIAVDLDNNRIYWRNDGGAWVNSADPTASSGGYTILAASATSSGHYHFAFGRWSGVVTYVINFGQDGTFAGNETAGGNADDNGYGNFLYAPPTGFLALCTKNLPEPAVVPSEHFSAILHSTTGGASLTGVGFQPDLIWSKARANSYGHALFDSVRGANKFLKSNINAVEVTPESGFDLLSFDSDGFTTGNNQYNVICGGIPYVAWNWKAGGTASSNTDGTITSTVSANVSAGFSIVSYAGNNASSATIGHGLSKAPELIILKPRNKVDDWLVGSLQPARSMDWTDFLELHTEDQLDDNPFWNDTAPTASVFSVGTSNTVNGSYNYIAYCFHDVEGYSKIGSYLGGGSASQGVFIYTGFKPAFVMIKSTNRNSSSWNMYDTARSPYNQTNERLRADANSSESTNLGIDIISNGFTPKTADGQTNTSNGQYMYIAFAETPFKYTNAR